MKIVIPLAVGLLIASCSASEKAPTVDDSSKIADVVSANATAADRSGDYDITAADGTKWRTTIGNDGTYSAAYSDGKRENGTVVDKDGMTCFDMNGDGQPRCWKLSDPHATGTFTATDLRGERVSVIKAGG